MNDSILTLILYIMAGLAIFLYGIDLMSTALQTLSSDKIKSLLKKVTNSTGKALLFGVLLTALCQSSSAITAITLSLITAKYLSFKKGLVVIIGSNIGTTFTSLIISLNIHFISPVFIFIGLILFLIYKKRPLRKQTGCILLGIGFLFYGLDLLTSNLETLFFLPNIYPYLVCFNHSSLLGFVTGTFVSSLIQSSSASIGIVQELYQAEAIGLATSVAFMLGANIGTTLTGLVASISGNKDAKKAAIINTIFNLIGSVLFMIFLTPYLYFIQHLSVFLSLNKSAEIALSHILYNLITVLLFFVFAHYYIKEEKG